MNNPRFRVIYHFLLLIILLFWNYIGQTGQLPYNISEISNKYESLFTPASFTFSIWGVIYLGLLIHSIYLIWIAFRRRGNYLELIRSAPILSLAYTIMIFWIWFWGNDQVGIAMFLLFAILLCLIYLVRKLRMELWDAPLSIMAFIWWPIDIFFGWICVASIANTSIYLTSIAWNRWGISESGWTIIIVGVVTALGLYLIAKRNMREVAAVFIWALFGIAFVNWEAHQEVSLSCIAAMSTLGIYSSFHAWQNRATLPFIRSIPYPEKEEKEL